MGVPTFFLNIIKNKNYKNVHSGVKDGKLTCDYFFLDYNGIVYSAYERVKKNIEGKNLTKNEIEEIVILEVIRYTKHLICEVVQPKKLTYIALDGPAPRAKMIQQRSRRYKGYIDKIYFNNEKIKLEIPIDENEWDKSANISPGTEFMLKLSNELMKIMKVKGFSTHCKNMDVILSDSNVPGEGEHKFMPIIKQMREKKGTENLDIYLYGKDADLIILALSTHKNNINIIRETAAETSLKNLYNGYEFIQINIDNLRDAFNHDLTRTFVNHQFDKIRILNDYVFLTFLVGNDFVLSMPYLKIKKQGLDSIIAIYHDIKENHSGYLINYHPDDVLPPTININFFKELIYEIFKKEDFEMKRQQKEVNKLMNGYKNNRRIEHEIELTPFEIFSSRYSHLEVCSSDHPLFEIYHKEFKKINYNQEYEIWKEEYYKYYLNINKSNEEEYLNIRIKLVENYLESLMFTLKYYFKGCPSWTWHYKYRISPLLSDIYYVLDNNLIDLNNIHFDIGVPYTPFQQLMIILPPQMNSLVPSVLRPIMTNDTLLCTQFYPTEIKLDVTVGIKTIYSEAILPEIDEDLLLETIKKYEKKLKPDEIIRNTISMKPKKPKIDEI
jgi:5'-3' exonuclease